jgi:XTP/dITP diphosphohydrolase
MNLILATHNPHKTREFRQLLGAEFALVDLASFPELKLPPETGSTFEQNAALKAVSVSQNVEEIVIADDSGLEVDVLNGAPGIYSARYAGKYATDAANIDKLLRELNQLVDRSARFRCVIALARAGKVLTSVEGRVQGMIVHLPRGNGGFGYDPVFQPAGFEQTFAEMPSEIKNRISHRGKAIAALREKLRAMN